jgi:hypothetical protein
MAFKMMKGETNIDSTMLASTGFSFNRRQPTTPNTAANRYKSINAKDVLRLS